MYCKKETNPYNGGFNQSASRMEKTLSMSAENSHPEPVDFDAMNFQAGMKLQFATYRSLTKVQYISTLIGWDAGEYMLIKLPRENNVVLNFFDGEKISVRAFSGTAICTFDATVVKAIHHPLYCLCLTFPASMQMRKLRREMRIKAAIDASASTATGSYQVKLDNLSATGALIRASEPIGAVDEVVALSFSLSSYANEDASLSNIKAKIRNIVEGANNDGLLYMIGAEFIEIDAGDQLMVRNHVYQAVLETRHNVV